MEVTLNIDRMEDIKGRNPYVSLRTHPDRKLVFIELDYFGHSVCLGLEPIEAKWVADSLNSVIHEVLNRPPPQQKEADRGTRAGEGDAV